jgi:putative transposase
MATVEQLALDLRNVRQACDALEVARASLYRRRRPRLVRERRPRPTPARALALAERQAVLDVLHDERFVDLAPPQVYAQLLDEGRYLCSLRSMYRILAAAREVKERRDVRRHPPVVKPRLVATAPNRVWTWDITKLAGPLKGAWFQLYVVLDLFSRYVVAWMIAWRALARLARRLLAEAFRRENVQPGQLTVHSDRGTQMVSQSVTELWATLGVVPSLSRPRVPDDNPFSESQFRTIKDRPDYPECFGSIHDAQAYGRHLFHWYNHEHRHSGLGLLTPAMVHFGRTDEVLTHRRGVLHAAHAAHPERFVHGLPEPPRPPSAVWINQPPAGALALEPSH